MDTTIKPAENESKGKAPEAQTNAFDGKKKRLGHQQTHETMTEFFDDDIPLDNDEIADPKKEMNAETHSSNSRKPSLCENIINDVKQTIGTHWVKEMTNFNQKTIAVSFFLFFAAVAPAITFGAIYAKVTHNYIGAVEMLAATAWCGIFYALIGGMPIVSDFMLG